MKIESLEELEACLERAEDGASQRADDRRKRAATARGNGVRATADELDACAKQADHFAWAFMIVRKAITFDAMTLRFWANICLVAVVLLAGCAGFNYDRLPPKPDKDQVALLTVAVCDSFLIDPESARYRGFTEPVPGYVRGPFWTVGLHGWTWKAEVNSKNSFGGYVGHKRGRFIYCEDGLARGWFSLNGAYDFEWPSDPVVEVGR